MGELKGEQWQMALYDEVAIAQRLGCKVKTLQAWRVRGGGPSFVRVGRLVRYRPQDVESWIDARCVASTSESTK